MLKIAKHEDTATGVEILRLEGKVVGRWVDELRRSCNEILTRPGALLVLDLAEVSFIDLEGLALFGRLVAQRAELRNCSGFAAEQLRELLERN